MTLLVSANGSWNIVHFRMSLLKALANSGFRIVVAAPCDGHSAAIREAGFEFHGLPMSRSGMNPFADALLLGRYWRLMRRVRPAVYLGYTIKPNLYGSIAAAGVGALTINTITGLGTSFLQRSWLRRLAGALYRLALRRSHRVIFQNRDDLGLFLDRKVVRAEQARLAPGSGIDLDFFHVMSDQAGVPPVFLFIGRLLRDKGVREFVEAAGLLRAELPGVRFQILGAIDPDNRTSVTAAELKDWVDRGLVEYLGPSDDVRPFIAGATAIVLPSYREGMPRTLLEGAAMGRPLIAADVPGCRELVEEGVTGALCRPRDARSLADAIARIALADGEHRRRLGCAARQRVERHFSDAAVIRVYLDAIEEAGLPAGG